jgi:hypothetical protein
MKVETLWGLVETRGFSSAYTQSHSILLKDNSALRMLFLWFENRKITELKELAYPEWIELSLQVRELVECDFYYDPQVPRIVIHSHYPQYPSYELAVKEYMNLLFYFIYGPRRESIMAVTPKKGELTLDELILVKKWCETEREALEPACVDYIAILQLEQHISRRMQDILWNDFIKSKGIKRI